MIGRATASTPKLVILEGREEKALDVSEIATLAKCSAEAAKVHKPETTAGKIWPTNGISARKM